MNKQKIFLGARIEPQIMEFVDRVAEEQQTDKTHALKLLVREGWKKLQLEKGLELYKHGKTSLDKAANIAGLTVSEMMDEAAAKGIKSEESIEDYKNGLNVLLLADKKIKTSM